MPTYRVRGNQVSILFRRMGREIERAVVEAEKDAMQEALRIARSLSSGPFSREELRRLGHPYRHGGRPPQDPAIINRQMGRFKEGWRVSTTRRTANGISSRLVNETPYARFLFRGTKRMIARPIYERIRQQLAPYRAAGHRAALQRGIQSAARSFG